MPEPSLLDVLKLALTRQRVYRGAMVLVGVYLICTGILRLGSAAGTESAASIRLILGAALLAAVRFVRAAPSSVPAGQSGEESGSQTHGREVTQPGALCRLVAWTHWDRLVLAYLTVLAGSWFLRRPVAVAGGGLLLMGAGLLLFLGVIRREGIDLRWPEGVFGNQPGETGVRWRMALSALALSALTFFSLPENRLTLACTALWIASVVTWMAAFWERPVHLGFDWRRAFLRLWRGEIELRLTRRLLLFFGILVVAAVFRFVHLGAVPGEMTSDHVEDLLSVNRILNEGERPIFEPANGGREPLAFYLMALMAHISGTGLTHSTLKIVSALAGFLTLPFIYLLAREVTDEDLSGLLAMLTAGVAWWPNVLGRLGLHISFTALFATTALWLIVRAIKRSQRNAALLSGLVTGAGLYASTPMWIVPIVTSFALLLAGLHSRQRPTVRRVGKYWAMSSIVVLAAFVPMLRYRLEHLGDLWASIQARVTGEYGQLSEPSVRSFLRNEWGSLRMFHWTSDGVWIVSPPGQPALDWVAAGLLTLGAAFLLYRYLRSRNWLDLFLLLSIPVLMLPSTLALAFEGRENPSLQRSSAVIPVVFTLAGIALAFLVGPCRRSPIRRGERAAAIGLMAAALGVSAWDNWRIVFRDYAGNYTGAAQNASGIGRIIHDFANSVGSYETAFVKGYPNWVDVRAVGIYAGKFGWEQAICDTCRFRDTGVLKDDERSKLFILHPMDQAFLTQLREVYPDGKVRAEVVTTSHHDFLIYFVPGRLDSGEYQAPSP